MADYALVLNAGSSSLKFCVYWRAGDLDWRLASRGQIDGIGVLPRIAAKDSEGQTLIDCGVAAEVHDGYSALECLARWLRSQYSPATVLGVGHRVVHGGPHFSAPVCVTSDVLIELRRLVPLAPLHQPYNLAAIDAVSARMPDTPQVA